MKIRNGFVSNSSSSSFIISKRYLTDKQVEQIHDYYVSALQLKMEGLPELTEDDLYQVKKLGLFSFYEKNPDKANDIWCDVNWGIHEELHNGETFLTGFTIIDNFDMYEFFQLIGVDMEKVSWEND